MVLRGDPGARAIEECVVEKPGVVVTAGDTNWPEELSEGVPITTIWLGAFVATVKLRDGREMTVQD